MDSQPYRTPTDPESRSVITTRADNDNKVLSLLEVAIRTYAQMLPVPAVVDNYVRAFTLHVPHARYP